MLALTLCELCASGCSNGVEGDEVSGSGQSSLCRGAVARLKECGVVTRGYFDCRDPYTEAADCLLTCLRDAECDAVRAVACDAAITRLDHVALLFDSALNMVAPPPLSDCYAACAPEPRTCSVDDGSTIPVNVLTQCDGRAHCADGSDEADCARHMPFACPRASDRPALVVSADKLCNGDRDCPEGGDEDDCPRFTCDDGGMILEAGRCDGAADCADSSDENGCGVLVCE